MKVRVRVRVRGLHGQLRTVRVRVVQGPAIGVKPRSWWCHLDDPVGLVRIGERQLEMPMLIPEHLLERIL